MGGAYVYFEGVFDVNHGYFYTSAYLNSSDGVCTIAENINRPLLH
jgi:hypothetical protein